MMVESEDNLDRIEKIVVDNRLSHELLVNYLQWMMFPKVSINFLVSSALFSTLHHHHHLPLVSSLLSAPFFSFP